VPGAKELPIPASLAWKHYASGAASLLAERVAERVIIADTGMLLGPGVAVIITIIGDHPLDVALSPTHLFFDLSLSFSFEPSLQTKVRTKQMVLPLKGDLIRCPLTAIYTSFVLVQGCSKNVKLAHGIVPLLFGAVCCCSLPLLPLLLSVTSKCESALRSLLSFLFRFLAHGYLIFRCLRFNLD
jgi:hypothetical protein